MCCQRPFREDLECLLILVARNRKIRLPIIIGLLVIVVAVQPCSEDAVDKMLDVRWSPRHHMTI